MLSAVLWMTLLSATFSFSRRLLWKGSTGTNNYLGKFQFTHIDRPLLSKLRMSTTTTPSLKKFILEYQYVENMIERRTPYRAEHLANAEKCLSENKLIAGGAYMPNADGAMFIFQGDYETVEAFVQNDPYFKAGLIPKYSIREWNVVIGKL